MLDDFKDKIKLVLDSTEIIEKENNLLLLKVKDTEESRLNLLKTGFLSSHLKYIRWFFESTESDPRFGDNLFSLIYEKSETNFYTGINGATLVSSQLSITGKFIKALVKSLNLGQGLFL